MTLTPRFEILGTFFSERLRSAVNKLRPYLDPSNLATIAFVAFAYFIAGKFGERWATPNHSVTAIWLPAGLSLAAILLRGHRVWPGTFAGAFLLSISITGLASISMCLALSNTMEALLGAYLVNKFASGIGAFFRAQDALRFVVFAAMMAPALCATFGVGLLCLGGLAKFSDLPMLWVVWWVGDMLGVLFLTPFLVLLLGHKHDPMVQAEPFELTILIAGLSIICLLDFGPQLVSWFPGNGVLFLCAPFLVWSALRFCPLEAAGAALVMGIFAMWGSLHSFGSLENATGLPLFVGVFLAVGIATTMTIAAASTEQKMATKDVLGRYCVLSDVKDGEIRVLRNTVEALEAELAKHGPYRTIGSSDDRAL